MGFEKDLPPGEKIVEYFLPFLQHLVSLDLSRKTIRKHTDNLWILGGEIIRDLNETPSLRKVPVEDLVFDVLQEGGPLLYHGDSEEQQRSFESTCRKFRRFLEHQHRGNLRRILRYDRRGSLLPDRIRLLGHVEALPSGEWRGANNAEENAVEQQEGA